MILFNKIHTVAAIVFLVNSMQAKAIGAFIALGDYPGVIYNIGVHEQVNNNYFSVGYGIGMYENIFNVSYNYNLLKFDNFYIGPGVALGHAIPHIIPSADNLNLALGCTMDLTWILSDYISIKSGIGYSREFYSIDNKKYASNNLMIRLFRLGYDFN